jgi:transcriptional regulator with XRE-family HTH domain
VVGEDLSAAVRETRVARGLSQAELARRAGITPSYLSRIEAAAWNEGGPWPSDGVLRSLARVLGLSSTALIDARTRARRSDRERETATSSTIGWRRTNGKPTYAVSIGDRAVRDAARRLVDENPRRGSLRATDSALLGRTTATDAGDDLAHVDPLASRLAADPEAVLYRVCSSTAANFPVVRHSTERLAGGREPTTVGNIRTRFCFGNPVVLDVVIGETEVLIALPDRRGHPYYRACVVVDDPDFVSAAREWYDESVWESPSEHVDIDYDRLDETLAAIEARLSGGTGGPPPDPADNA